MQEKQYLGCCSKNAHDVRFSKDLIKNLWLCIGDWTMELGYCVLSTYFHSDKKSLLILHSILSFIHFFPAELHETISIFSF